MLYLKVNKKVATHIIVLITAVLTTLLWVTDEKLSGYSLQLTAFLMLTLIISRRIAKQPSFRLVESTVSTIAVLLIASSTGGIASPLFFLNYFLLFELSLLLEPVIPLVLSVLLIAFYLLTAEIGMSPFRWLELLAFPFMTPLSYFFGKIYQKEENQKKEIQNLTKKVEELKEELVEEEIKNA